jgi:hypothetical protein
MSKKPSILYFNVKMLQNLQISLANGVRLYLSVAVRGLMFSVPSPPLILYYLKKQLRKKSSYHLHHLPSLVIVHSFEDVLLKGKYYYRLITQQSSQGIHTRRMSQHARTRGASDIFLCCCLKTTEEAEGVRAEVGIVGI